MRNWLVVIGFLLLPPLLVSCSENQQAPGVADQSPATTEDSPVPRTPAEQPPARPKAAVLWVKGLSCPVCVQEVKKELNKVDGVEQIDINYDQEFATVTLSSRKPPTRRQLEEAVKRTGYRLAKLDLQ